MGYDPNDTMAHFLSKRIPTRRVTARDRRMARKYVRKHSQGKQDTAHLLEILGLD